VQDIPYLRTPLASLVVGQMLGRDAEVEMTGHPKHVSNTDVCTKRIICQLECASLTDVKISKKEFKNVANSAAECHARAVAIFRFINEQNKNHFVSLLPVSAAVICTDMQHRPPLRRLNLLICYCRT